MLTVQTGHGALEVSRFELKTIVEQKAIRFGIGICPVLYERVCASFARNGLEEYSAGELCKLIRDHEDVVVASRGLRLRPRQVQCNKRKRFGCREELKLSPRSILCLFGSYT